MADRVLFLATKLFKKQKSRCLRTVQNWLRHIPFGISVQKYFVFALVFAVLIGSLTFVFTKNTRRAEAAGTLSVYSGDGPWNRASSDATTNTLTTNIDTYLGSAYFIFGITAQAETSVNLAIDSVSGCGLTWAKLSGGTAGASNRVIEYWGAVMPSNPGACSITVTTNYNAWITSTLDGLINVNLSNPVGVIITPSEESTNLSATFSGVTGGSMLYAIGIPSNDVFGTFSGTGVRVLHVPGLSPWGQYQYIRSQNAVAAGNVTIATGAYDSNPGTIFYTGIEILGLSNVVANAGNSYITASGPTVANGTNLSTVKIYLRDSNGNNIYGLTPTFSVSGTNNSLNACSESGLDGIATCSFTSTTAEIKHLSILTPVAARNTPVTFVDPASVSHVSRDANGWTVVTASADSQTVYVSFSGGDDANDGLAPESPKKTFAAGYELLRDGYPDHLLLKRGDEWPEVNGHDWDKSGRSPDEPMFIGSYGSGERPIINIGLWNGLNLRNGSSNLVVTDLVLIGLNHNPAHGTPTGWNGTCISIHNSSNDILIENVKVDFCGSEINANYENSAERVTIRRSTFLDQFLLKSTDTGTTSALAVSGANALRVEENVFDNCGWHPDIPDALPQTWNIGDTTPSACIWFNPWRATGGDSIIKDNLILRGAEYGIYGQAAGHLEGNVLAGNAIGLSFDQNYISPGPGPSDGEVVGNLITEGQDILPREGHAYANTDLGRGWGIWLSYGNNMRVRDNIITGCNSVSANKDSCLSVPTSLAVNDGGIINDVNNNIVWGWPSSRDWNWPVYPAASWQKENKGPFVDPTRTLGGYNATLGGTATFNAFVAAARNQSKDNWQNVYRAPSVISYFRQGFTTTVPTVTVDEGPWYGAGEYGRTTASLNISTSKASYVLLGISARGDRGLVTDSVTGGGLVWTKLAGGAQSGEIGWGHDIEYWGAVSSGALNNITVTVSVPNANYIGLAAESLLGVETNSPVGLTIDDGKSSNRISFTMHGTTAGSMVFAAARAHGGGWSSAGTGENTETYANLYEMDFVRESSSGLGGDVTLSGSVFSNTELDFAAVEIMPIQPVPHNVNYTAGPGGSISGSASQTIDYLADASSVTAVPATGYHFVNWSDGSLDNPRTDRYVVHTINVTANFAINVYNLSYAAGAHGTLSGVVSQNVDYNSSGQVVTAVPAQGYHFVKWSDDSTQNPRVDTNVAGNVSVTASFSNGPAIISSVATALVTNNSAVITWFTDENTTSQVVYGPTTAYGSQTAVAPTLVTGHTVKLTGLTGGTTYYFKVVSTDIYNNTTTDDNAAAGYTFTTNVSADTTPPVITDVSSQGISLTGATIHWTTNELANSFVLYGTTTGTELSSGSLATYGTDHSVVLSGLSQNVKYYFKVQSADASGNIATNDNSGNYYDFTTASDVTAPGIINVSNALISDTSAVITWNTSEPATSQILYSTPSDPDLYGRSAGPYAVLTTAHSVTITGLTALTNYVYKVISADSSGNVGTNDNGGSGFTLTTVDVPGKILRSLSRVDTTVPNISNIQISSIKQNSATISWLTDKAASSVVKYGTTTSYGSIQGSADEAVVMHEVNMTNLSAGTVYHFVLLSVDNSGNKAYSTDQIFATLNVDGTAPEIPSTPSTQPSEPQGTVTPIPEPPKKEPPAVRIMSAFNSLLKDPDLSAVPESSFVDTINEIINRVIHAPTIVGLDPKVDVTGTTAKISWTTDKNANSAIAYADAVDYKEGAGEPYSSVVSNPDDNSTLHVVQLDNLLPATTYHFQVRSKGSIGAEARSLDRTFKTTSVLPVISGLKIGTIKDTAVSLVWVTNIPTSTNIEYKNSNDGTTLTQGDTSFVREHSFVLENLDPGAFYTLVVNALDEQGNKTVSKPASFSTSKDVLPPKIAKASSVSTLFPGKQSRVQTIVSWETDELSTSQVFYSEGLSADAPIVASQYDSAMGVHHTIVLTNFQPSTVYRYWVESTDRAGNTAKSENFILLTPQQKATIIDVIMKNFEQVFGWTNRLGNK